MKKRIVAAVLSLLLAASSVPLAEFSSLVPKTDITASAYGDEVKVKNYAGEEFDIGYSQGTDNEGRTFLKISVPVRFFENRSEVITWNLSITSVIR